MSLRTARILAWSLFALYLGIALLTVAVLVFGSFRGDAEFEAGLVVAVTGYALVGALVASRQPGNAVGWLLLAIGLSLSLGALADINVQSGSAPLLSLSAWIGDWGFYVWLTLAAIFLPLLFPDGRLVSPRWRPTVWLGVAALAASVLGAALRPGRIDADSVRPVENPLGVGGAAEDVVAALATAGDVLAAAAFLLAAASLVVRFRRSHGLERQQLKWFAYVGVLLAAGLALAMAQVLAGVEEGEEGGWIEVLGTVGWLTALATIAIGIPVAAGFAILKHRLYDIDVVINRTLVYGALTATLLSSYLGLVLLLQLVLSPLTEQSDLAVAGSTLAVAALFGPARGRIQQLVDRRFYRRKYDAAHEVDAFSARLRDQVELDALSGELRAVVGDTMQPAHVSLWLRPSGAGR